MGLWTQLAVSSMREEREKNNDRDGDAKQPKKNASAHAAAATAPAAQDTADCASTIVDAGRKSESIESLPDETQLSCLITRLLGRSSEHPGVRKWSNATVRRVVSIRP